MAFFLGLEFDLTRFCYICTLACSACQENTGQMSELISRLADVEQQLDEKEEAIIKMEQVGSSVDILIIKMKRV